MKAGSILLLAVLVLPVGSFAQKGNYGYGHERSNNYIENGSALTVYSETGEKFFLVVNGFNQNTNPQSRVHVDGLPQVTNDVQIIFADSRTHALQKRITFSNPVDDRPVNLVMKIDRMQDGYPILAFSRCTPVMRDYRPEQDEYAMHYCREVVKQQQTRNVPPPPPPAPRAMDAQTFSEAKRTISSSSFDATKLSTAKTILSSNFVCTDQVMEICRLFSFEDSKLDFAKFAYGKTVDPGSYFKVGNVFSFSASKEDLNNFITSSAH